MADKSFEITQGPGKWDLVLGTFEPGKKIVLTVSSGGQDDFVGSQILVVISGVSLADSFSGREVWNFDGFAESFKVQGSRPCNGCYSIRKRSGWIKISEP